MRTVFPMEFLNVSNFLLGTRMWKQGRYGQGQLFRIGDVLTHPS